jgi:O-glycosyl hydrolase
MYQRLLFCFVLVAVLTAHAQDINIRGKVTNSAGDAVAGAIVELMNEGIKDTTESDGAYLITDATGVIARSLMPQTEKIALVKGVLKLALTRSSSVKVEIFDVSGNLLKKEMYRNHEAGYYSLNVAEHAHTSSMLVIYASIGKQKKTFRYLPLQNGRYATNISNEGYAAVGGKLAKMAAAVNDTLKVTADGYQENKTPVTSYDQELNITLQTEIAGDVVAVRLDQEKQTIQGFGINATIMPGSLPWSQLFTLEGQNALGLSILRIGMAEGGGHRDVPNDWTTVRSVNPDVKVIGSCWSAPADWKDNNSVNGGGHLYPDRYDDWATRQADYAKNNNLYAMGVANEADFASGTEPPRTGHYPSMVYTGKEMAEFIKVAGPIYKERAPGVKLIGPEASLWIHVWSNISPTGIGAPGAPNGGYNSVDPLGCGCFSNDITEAAMAQCAQKCNNGDGYDYGHWLAADEEAWNQLDILGVHEYESQKAYKWPDDVTGGKRTKEIWQTEMSGVMYWPEQGPSVTIENGVAVARWIQSALMIGEASAWCYWWYESYYANDNEGLAIIQNNNQIAKRYYAMGNYSRYIRPGQKVVNITGTDQLPEKVLLTASKDDNGKVVIVAVNETTSAQSVDIAIAGGTAPASFTPIVTNASENWSEKSAVSVTDGVLTMELGRMSVTTFLSQ